MDGIEVLRVLRRGRVPIPVIAISGTDPLYRESLLRTAELLGAQRVLAKPFEREALLAAVRELLVRGKEGGPLKEVTYLGWIVEAPAQALADGRWTPRTALRRSDEDVKTVGPSKEHPGMTFDTQVEAEEYARCQGRAWIDANG